MPEAPAAGLITVVGGESTGKSTLAAALGDRLPAVVVGEFLRDWVDRRGRVPGPAEQIEVLTGHRESELTALREADRTGRSWVVSDSGPLMTAVYSVQYYDDASLLPVALEWAQHSTLLVWCQDDFPWSPDPQRDGPQARATSQQILADTFAGHPAVSVLTVRGSTEERVRAVQDRLSSVARAEVSPGTG